MRYEWILETPVPFPDTSVTLHPVIVCPLNGPYPSSTLTFDTIKSSLDLKSVFVFSFFCDL